MFSTVRFFFKTKTVTMFKRQQTWLFALNSIFFRKLGPTYIFHVKFEEIVNLND